MYLYDEKGQKTKFDLQNKIGSETFGNVFKISDTECLKIYKNSKSINEEILHFIKELNLKNFYKILNFYYTSKGIFKAHSMEYYQEEKIDILTMPTEYLLNNIFRINCSVTTLTKNSVQIEDLHTGNIILDNNNITVIDTDLYSFNRFYTPLQLEYKNIEKLEYLLREILLEAVVDYHKEYRNLKTVELIREMFNLKTTTQIEETYKKLSKYTYPIDYIKKKIKLR